jgi:hypothetical protein
MRRRLRLRSHLRNASAWQAEQTPSAVTNATAPFCVLRSIALREASSSSTGTLHPSKLHAKVKACVRSCRVPQPTEDIPLECGNSLLLSHEVPRGGIAWFQSADSRRIHKSPSPFGSCRKATSLNVCLLTVRDSSTPVGMTKVRSDQLPRLQQIANRIDGA